MKRAAGLVVLILYLCALLCGCDLWERTYISATPHKDENARPKQDVVNVLNYLELQNALVSFVDAGQEDGIISVGFLNEKYLPDYMKNAVEHVKTVSPIGAYAVEDISYELGTNAGKAALAVKIKYNHRYDEIFRIVSVENMEQAQEQIDNALNKFETGIVLKISAYTETDFAQYVQSYGEIYPEYCIEIPQVKVAVFPDSGSERVVELTFTYQTNRESLRKMQSEVAPVFRASVLNVSSAQTQQEKFSLIYTFLMERYDYKIETSITPAYSLLRHGVGDSKAFATVFAAMCRQAGLECQTVTGTRQGEPRVWNIICQDNSYFHVDLLASNSQGRMRKVLDKNMAGYVWDYSAYPKCK